MASRVVHILLDNHFGELNENRGEMFGAACTAAEAANAAGRIKPSALIDVLRPMLIAAVGGQCGRSTPGWRVDHADDPRATGHARITRAMWRERLFGITLRNATPASAFFGLQPNRVVEPGAQIEI